MNKPLIPYFTRKQSSLAIIGFVFILLLCIVMFFTRSLPLMWVAFALLEVIGFFFFASLLGRSWFDIPRRQFLQRLFGTALFIRLVWVVASYFFFEHQTGIPFEFAAGDSLFYHEVGSALAERGIGQINEIAGDVSLPDRGFPIYLSLIYSVFGDHVIIPRIINAILGAWTCVFVFQLTRRNFGDKVARIAGILLLLAPMLIYLTGLHLKETVMIFLLVTFMERADWILRKRSLKFTDLIILSLLGISLYFFRTVLFFSALFSVFSVILLSAKGNRTILNRAFIGIWIVVVLWIFFSAQIIGELEYLTGNINIQETNLQWRAVREGGNRLATYGSSLLFAPFMLMVPFPTLVNIETQQEIMMLSGAYYTKNIISFFVLTALILIIKEKTYRKHILILSFILIYLAILTKSSFSLSGRFHMPLMPFYMILAAYGIVNFYRFGRRYYIPYIVLVAAVIIVWNWFKLAGRGII